jgi:hypothetical protein
MILKGIIGSDLKAIVYHQNKSVRLVGMIRGVLLEDFLSESREDRPPRPRRGR